MRLETIKKKKKMVTLKYNWESFRRGKVTKYFPGD